MRLLITGGSGFIGKELIKSLLADNHNCIVLTRSPKYSLQQLGESPVLISNLSDIPDDQRIDAVVNLAGEPILDQRWTEQQKHRIRDSRIGTTRAVVDLIKRLSNKPIRLVSGSAIGYYGPRSDDLCLTEEGEVVPGFTHQLCYDWEAEALSAREQGVSVALIRTGVVLGEGGALSRMLLPFKMGLGGPIGSGQQWFSWIHINDMVAAIRFLLDDGAPEGAFNLTAPTPVTNGEFSKSLGACLNRPAVLPTPAWVIKLMVGEGAELLVEGQRVLPDRLLSNGFEFQYPELSEALSHILN